MPISAIIISGLSATAVMTVIHYFFTLMLGRKPMGIPLVLGTLLTNSTQADGSLCEHPTCFSIGTMAHYSMGIFFIFCYQLLWNFSVGRPDMIYALIFGLVHGVLSVGIWKVFFWIHPNPPKIRHTHFFGGILIAHIFFAVSAVIVYNMVNQWIRIGSIQP